MDDRESCKCLVSPPLVCLISSASESSSWLAVGVNYSIAHKLYKGGRLLGFGWSMAAPIGRQLEGPQGFY